MKTITKYILAGLVLGSAVGCKERMIEFNSDPRVVSDSKPEYLFTRATSNFDMRGRGAVQYKYSGVMQLMQYVSKYGDGNPYVDPVLPSEKAPSSYADYYSQFFSSGGQGNYLISIIRDIDKMNELEQKRYQDIRAISQVVYAYQQWRLVEQYGAIVYDEAFKAQTEAILRPKYQLGKDIYVSIDAALKQSIGVLMAEPDPSNVALGANDYFFGYYLNPNGTQTRVASYKIQRANWLRFANMARLQMAWKLKKVQPEFYETVKNEVLAVPNGFMTKIEEGAYYNYPANYDDNPDDVDVISQQYALSNTLITVLKATNDPRLQYLARPNGVSSVNSFNYRVIKQLYPDSLAKYGELLQDGNIFQGQVSNPRFQNQRPVPTNLVTEKNPNFVGVFTMNFVLPNSGYPTDSVMYTDPDGKRVKVCSKEDKTFTMAIQIASPAQGRYFVKGGGKNEKNGNTSISTNVNSLKWDGPGVWNSAGNDALIPLRRPIITYAHQCFMFAHLGITHGGKSPMDWYKEGVKSALVELRDDATRYQIQVATPNINYPIFPGYNPDGTFRYTDADIDAYLNARLAAPGFNLEEDAINQAWIYFYQAPEHAYSWWKTTGLPKFLTHATPAQSQMVTNAYLETPFKNSAEIEPLVYPRRSSLSMVLTNDVNYLDIKAKLQEDTKFGEWPNTAGRVWFDVE